MIKLGTTTVRPAGISKAYIGNKLVYYTVPSVYRELTGIIYQTKTYYLIDNFHLMGSDTVRLSMSTDASCNVFGCYTTTTAEDNYSLYASTATSAKYMRYNGGTYKSRWTSSDFGTRFDIVVTPTGTSGMPTGQDDTWTESSFTSVAEMCIGSTSETATSSKFKGTMYGNFVVDGRFLGIPVERISDGVIGYYDVYTNQFYEPVGDNPTILGYL